MLQLENGQAQPITEAQPTKPRYTGEILMRTRPKTYRKVIEALARGQSVNSITRDCKVTEHTVLGIRERHEATITERKSELVVMLSDVAHIGTARVMDMIGKARCRDAIIGTGVAVDKILALTGTQAPNVGVVIMPSDTDRQERRELHDKLDAIARRLSE